jgi:outer membrane protein assembly factor BamB
MTLKRSQFRGLGRVFFAGLWFGLSGAGWAGDWPQYRGVSHDGVSQDRILTSWPASGPTEVWRVACTNGLSSFAVSGGRAYTLIRRDGDAGSEEVCVAMDARTGATLWSSSLGAASYDGSVGSDDGPRSTPSVSNGRVLVLTSYLGLYCLNATNGATNWSKDLLALYGGSVISWQNAASPLVDNDLVFVNGNAGSQCLMAFRASDGSLAWRSQNSPMTHSTPVAATICGVPQIVFAAQNGLISVNRTNGTLLWKTAYSFSYSTSLATSPVVWSNVVFISGAYSMGSYATRVSLTNSVFSTRTLWNNTGSGYQSHWMTPVCYQGFLYGMFGSSSTSPLKCIDIQTGAQKWSANGYGRGGVILAGGQLLALTETGGLVLVKASTNACTELARFTAFPGYDSDVNKCWNGPAVCDGKIYARSTAEAVCLDVSVPALKMGSPVRLSGSRLQLWVGTETGGAIDTNRLAKITLRHSGSLSNALAGWSVVTNRLVLSNGMACAVIPATNGNARFYIATETP